MAHTIVIAALTERAAEIRGQIAALEGQIIQQRADLHAVLTTLRMYDPTASAKQIKPKRVPPPRSTYFAMGEISRRCRDALRVATGPISAEDIAVKAMADKGLDASDTAIRSDMITRLLWALHRQAKAGQIVRIGFGLGARWTLPTV